MNIDELRDQLEELAGPLPRASSIARAAVSERVRHARRRRALTTGGASALAALLVVAIVAVGLQGSNGRVQVRTTTPPATTAATDPQCALGVPTVPRAQVPTAVAAWAGPVAVVGEGDLWSVRRNIASGPIHDGAIYRLKIGWFTIPWGLPTITARRLDAQGHAVGDANEAIDQRGKWVASTIELPAAGCWEITATYKQSTIVFRRLVGNPPRPLAIGTISGVLEEVGGPVPGTPRPVIGTIHIANSTTDVHDVDVSVETDAHGRFRVDVSAGGHVVIATSPQYQGGRADCTGGTVIVRPGATVHVDVDCQID